ncbi:MAG: SCO family protein [Pirellulaceae bacterium]
MWFRTTGRQRCRPTRNNHSVAPTGIRWSLAVGILAVATACIGPLPRVHAQTTDPGLKPLDGVGIEERLGEPITLDAAFVDSNGRAVTLRDFFDGQRPVLLTMNYSDCPMLCSLQLNGLLDGLQRMKWNLGENFQVLTVSINPRESPARSQLTKQKYLKQYGRPGVSRGWRFLTGREEEIQRLADEIGFGYAYVKDTGEYAHAAVAMILTPDGRISRYLYGVTYDPQTLRLSLVEAGDGTIGSTMDQILLFCFHYDETKGRFGPAAVGIMRMGGVLTLLCLGGMLLMFWRRESARSRKQSMEEQPAK